MPINFHIPTYIADFTYRLILCYCCFIFYRGDSATTDIIVTDTANNIMTTPANDAPDPYIPKRKASSTISGEVNIEVPKFFLGDNSETAV